MSELERATLAGTDHGAVRSSGAAIANSGRIGPDGTGRSSSDGAAVSHSNHVAAGPAARTCDTHTRANLRRTTPT